MCPMFLNYLILSPCLTDETSGKFLKLIEVVSTYRTLFSQFLKLLFIFVLTFIQMDYLLQPVETPPAGQLEECRFKALPHWLHFSEPEVSACAQQNNQLCFSNKE